MANAKTHQRHLWTNPITNGSTLGLSKLTVFCKNVLLPNASPSRDYDKKRTDGITTNLVTPMPLSTVHISRASNLGENKDDPFFGDDEEDLVVFAGPTEARPTREQRLLTLVVGLRRLLSDSLTSVARGVCQIPSISNWPAVKAARHQRRVRARLAGQSKEPVGVELCDMSSMPTHMHQSTDLPDNY